MCYFMSMAYRDSRIRQSTMADLSKTFKTSRRNDSLDYLRSLVSMISSMDYDDNTDGRMLFDAIRKGKHHLVRFILEASPATIVNARDFNGKTPLIVVSSIKEEIRRSSVTRLLLTHGADINLQDDHGRTPLSYACEKRCNDLVEIFVKQTHIDPDVFDDKGNTALMYCTMVGNDIATHVLLRHFRRLGLKVDMINKDGYTPLLMAAKNGFITCARMLFQQGQASLVPRDPISLHSVEEFLEKNGYTLEDLLPFSKVEAKRRFVKAISIARFAKSGISSLQHDPTKRYERHRIHKGSTITTHHAGYENEFLNHLQRSHLMSMCPLPSVKKTPGHSKGKKGKPAVKGSTCNGKPAVKGVVSTCNGNAIIPAISRGYLNNGIQANASFESRFPITSVGDENTTEEEVSDEETDDEAVESRGTDEELI